MLGLFVPKTGFVSYLCHYSYSL